MTRSWPHVRLAAVLIVALIVQGTFGADLRVLGVAPDLMLLMAICGGLVCGPGAAALIGFAAGLLADLSLLGTPVGLSALSWCLVGWGVATVRTYALPESRFVRPATAFLATVGAVVLFLAVGDLLGQGQLLGPGRTYVIRVVTLEALWNAVLAVPAAALVRWAAQGLPGVAAPSEREPLALR